MNRSAGEVMCKSALSSPIDWILRYIKTYLYFTWDEGERLTKGKGTIWEEGGKGQQLRREERFCGMRERAECGEMTSGGHSETNTLSKQQGKLWKYINTSLGLYLSLSWGNIIVIIHIWLYCNPVVLLQTYISYLKTIGVVFC